MCCPVPSDTNPVGNPFPRMTDPMRSPIPPDAHGLGEPRPGNTEPLIPPGARFIVVGCPIVALTNAFIAPIVALLMAFILILGAAQRGDRGHISD